MYFERLYTNNYLVRKTVDFICTKILILFSYKREKFVEKDKISTSLSSRHKLHMAISHVN